MDRLIVQRDSADRPSSEGSGEIAPVIGGQGPGEPSMRLVGGSGGPGQGDSAHMNGSRDSSGAHDDEEQRHSSSRVSVPELSNDSSATSKRKHKLASPPTANETESLDSELRQGSKSGPRDDKPDINDTDQGLYSASQQDSKSEEGADKPDEDNSGDDASSPGQGLGSGQDGAALDLQREVSLGSASAASSTPATDAALYEGLNSLQGEPSALGDLSSESEEDAAVAAERLKLGQFPVEVHQLGSPLLNSHTSALMLVHLHE